MLDKLPENTNPNSVEKKSLPSEKTSGVSYQNIVDIFSKSLFSLKSPKSSKDEKEDLSKKSNEESINLIELLKQNKVFANLDQISKSLNETTKLLKYNNDLVAKEADDAKEISSSEDESFTEQEAEDERQHKELIDAIKNIKGGGGKEKQKDSNSSFPPILGTLSKILSALLIVNGIYQLIKNPIKFAGITTAMALGKKAGTEGIVQKGLRAVKQLPPKVKPTTATPKPTPEVVGKPDLTKAADPKPDKLNQPGDGNASKTINEAGEIVDNKAIQKVEQKTGEVVETKVASGSIKQLAKKAVDPKVIKDVLKTALTPKNVINFVKTAGVGVLVELGTKAVLKDGLGMTGGESAKTDGANAGEVIQSGPRRGMVAQQKNGALDNAAELAATAAGGAAVGGPVGAVGAVIASEILDKPKIVDMVAQSVGINPEAYGGGTENRGNLYNVKQLATTFTPTGAGELVSGIGQMTGLGELTGLQESEESKNKKSVKEYSDQAKNWAAKNTPEFIKSISEDAKNTAAMEEVYGADNQNSESMVKDISAKLKDYVKEGIISQKQADSVSKNFSESSQKKIKEAAAIPKLSEVAVGASAVGSAEKKPDLVASSGDGVGFKEIYGILQVIAAKTGSGGGGSGVTNSTEIASETVGSTVNNEAIFRESDSQDTSRST